MTQDKRHIPRAGDAHNQQTRPADTRDVDKLRENPHNDEKTISQTPGLHSRNTVDSESTFAQKDEEGMNEVTNEQEQNQVVNPGGKDWESKAREEGPGEKPEGPSPSKTPYEEIGDDPEEMRKKIPKM